MPFDTSIRWHNASFRITQDKTEKALFTMKRGLVRWFRGTDQKTSPVSCLLPPMSYPHLSDRTVSGISKNAPLKGEDRAAERHSVSGLGKAKLQRVGNLKVGCADSE